MENHDIIQRCKDLSIAYARHVDFGQYDQFVDLFTEDGVLELGFTLSGKEKIRQSMQRRPDELRSMHVLTNIHIEVHSATVASGISYLTLYRHIGPESLQDEPIALSSPAGVGYYSDKFRLTDAGWRFAHRKLTLTFRNPEFF